MRTTYGRRRCGFLGCAVRRPAGVVVFVFLLVSGAAPVPARAQVMETPGEDAAAGAMETQAPGAAADENDASRSEGEGAEAQTGAPDEGAARPDESAAADEDAAAGSEDEGVAADDEDATAAAQNGADNKVVVTRETLAEAQRVAMKLIADGKAEQALQLLTIAVQEAQQNRPVPDLSALRFTAAQAMLALQYYAQAARVLGRLSRERPELARIRLDLAGALYALGRDEEAEGMFRRLLAEEELPGAVQRNIERFLERIRARRKFRLDWDFGLWRDDNVNNAPEIKHVQVPAFGDLRFAVDQQPVRAWVAQTGVKLRLVNRLSAGGRLALHSRAGASRHTALGKDEHSRSWFDVSSGPRYQYLLGGRPGRVALELGVERRLRDRKGYALGGWAGLNVEQALSRSLGVGAGFRYWRTAYDDISNDRDPDGHSVSVFLTRRFGSGAARLLGGLSREKPELEHLGWRGKNLRFSYHAPLGRNWNVGLEVGRNITHYRGRHSLFRTRRKDRTTDVQLDISNRELAFFGLLPKLVLGFSRTASSNPLSERRSRMVRMELQRIF